MGRALAAKAIEVARRLKPAAKIDASLHAAGEVIEFRDRWEREKTLRAGITALLINNEIAIATLPGEPFVEFQIALRDKAEIPRTYLFGYTYSAGGEWVGYIPTIRAAAEGGYGAGYNTRIEVGAGEAMIDRLLAHLYQMAGKLREVPR
jgi:neutral ceramidase